MKIESHKVACSVSGGILMEKEKEAKKNEDGSALWFGCQQLSYKLVDSGKTQSDLHRQKLQTQPVEMTSC